MNKLTLPRQPFSTSEETREAMAVYMILLSLDLEVLGEIEGTPFYSGKVKMKTKALIQELEWMDKAINRRHANQSKEEYQSVMMQYAHARESLYLIFTVWRKLVSLDEKGQILLNEDLNNLINQYIDKT